MGRRKTDKVPEHLGIILDGNRRWARERGLPDFEGHRQGLERVKQVAKWCQDRGIKVLTLYVFSTENWNRPEKEVSFLMRLAAQNLTKNLIRGFHRAGIRVRKKI